MRLRLRAWVLRAGIVLTLLAAAGFVVAASGIVPMKASSGHWPITLALLQFAKNRSIQTHSLAIDVPELGQQWQVMKGAGHYENGCAPCHGSPAQSSPRIAAAMLPKPPSLSQRVAGRNPAQLFYVVRHGLKFTGMPAWPSPERDDEVWAMVAFLRELPRLDSTAYRRLVDGEASPATSIPPLIELGKSNGLPTVVRSSCARCHGLDGQGRGRGNPAFPRLAGQKRAYLIAALEAYRTSRRHSGIMEPIAAALTEDEQMQAAVYYGGLTSDAGTAADRRATGSISRGESIARDGIPDRGVPACMDCHGPGEHRRNAAYPDLAGQYAGYIVLQLDLFRSGRRGGSPFAHLMRFVAPRLDPGEARDVAAYYESLASDRGGMER